MCTFYSTIPQSGTKWHFQHVSFQLKIKFTKASNYTNKYQGHQLIKRQVTHLFSSSSIIAQFTELIKYLTQLSLNTFHVTKFNFLNTVLLILLLHALHVYLLLLYK